MQSSTWSWQAAATEADAGEITAYLERVATMPLLRAVAARSLGRLRLSRCNRVLEVGCGSGVLLPQLAEVVGPQGQVVGIDHSAALVAVAHARVADIEAIGVQQADAYALPFENDSFDAAHCERVLMHLSDPSRALLEMRRVVRPGGWIVAAEPDWGGLQMASSDSAAVADLVANWVRHLAQPRMGLELYRRMAEVGLTERSVEPIVSPVTDYRELVAYGLDLEQAARALSAGAVLTMERSRAVLEEFGRRSDEGQFFGYLGVFIVVGRVPLVREDNVGT